MMQRDPILVYFANYIEAELGIVYADHNDFQLQKRLDEIAKHLGLQDVNGLYAHSKNGVTGSFRQLLLDVATNNETSFFRDPKIFDAIQSNALPELHKSTPKRRLRIWSAASSTGQEPLSMAMLVLEWQKLNAVETGFEILATDISDRALTKAKSGFYSEIEVGRGLSPARLAEYFSVEPQTTWRARSNLTNSITYRELNLKESFNFADKFDLVLCRNVLIYQGVENKISILKKITDSLNPGGFLVMGSGESLMGLSKDYDRATIDSVVLYRKKSNGII